MRELIARGACAIAAGLLAVVPAAGAPAAVTGGQTAPLTAGASSVEVMLPPGVPLAGYGGFPRRSWLPDALGRHPYAFWFRPSTGVHDHLHVRGLVLESGSVRVLWLAVDLVGTDPSLVSELRGRLSGHGLHYSAVIVSASHTHSGPGAYARSRLFGFVAVDRLSGPVRERILDGLDRAAREAEAHREPAVVATGQSEVPDIAESRVQQPLDTALGVVKLTAPTGRPLALIWNFAIHGTALSRENFLLSGDLMGEASIRIERQTGAPALFVNGAVGDVSPRPRGWRGVAAGGEALAEGALRAAARAQVEPGRLEVAIERVALPAPALHVKNCLAGWAPGWMTIGLGAALPSSAEVTALAIGRTGWVTIPGELETSLGLEIKARGGDRYSRVLIAGVSNDYLGYFLTPADFRRPSYIACGSLYGERGGEIVRDAALAALDKLGQADGHR
ncbi:MAG TPA: neutral/alkaline non-lysosomal ceramidase N-terminal domain-containing protein [Candidatus Methylomirabilis sp.]|nr:neutral/alkaline non-lysosomal ceramidase N-terminal domain-containing protein [Candidatus Methylomirabilis sp.]